METTTQIIRKERCHSFEFGKAGNRFKVYFDTPDELRELLKGLEDWIGKDWTSEEIGEMK